MVQRALSLSWQTSPQDPPCGGIENSFDKYHRLLTFPCVGQMSKCFILAIGTPVGIPSASISVSLSSRSQRFCINGFALSLALKQKLGATREWPMKCYVRLPFASISVVQRFLFPPFFRGRPWSEVSVPAFGLESTFKSNSALFSLQLNTKHCK